ncbi:hypothetical protein ACFQ69_34800, partial [Streptomyces sp. NPDC056470]|uniref:hypothetical protein n=1 Tax=Streptomyces sp. NPDC056470 TaxID=3345831 RepID=UPI003695FD26
MGSGPVSGAGSVFGVFVASGSKAGRAWCQGASELRGRDGAGGGAAWLAEPSDALRVRRGGRTGASGASPASDWVAGPSAAWLAEPSDALRVRRGGRTGASGASPASDWVA